MEISREAPCVLCVASDFYTFHPPVPPHTALLGLLESQTLVLVEEKKNSHFAVGFVKSSIF